MDKKLSCKETKKAFSVLELMVVLAIISMVIGTMKVHIKHRKFQAEAKNIVEIAKIYETAVLMYCIRHGGKYPALSSTWSENHLESIAALKPYCPTGFNTKEMIKSKKCKDITYFYMEIFDWVLFNIFIELEDEPELVDEIKRQLCEFVETKRVETTKQSGAFSVTFYIQQWDKIYI